MDCKTVICLLTNFLLLQALSVGIFPYVLKLLQTTTPELRQILVFIWTKILALDKVYLDVLLEIPCLEDYMIFNISYLLFSML